MKLSEQEGNWRLEEITAALTTVGLEDMSEHFLPRRRPWCRDSRMWRMVWAGRELRSRMDYILGTDPRLFWDVYVWDPRNNLDHYLIFGCIRGAPLREHSVYLGRRKRLPLQPSATPTRED